MQHLPIPSGCLHEAPEVLLNQGAWRATSAAPRQSRTKCLPPGGTARTSQAAECCGLVLKCLKSSFNHWMAASVSVLCLKIQPSEAVTLQTTEARIHYFLLQSKALVSITPITIHGQSLPLYHYHVCSHCSQQPWSSNVPGTDSEVWWSTTYSEW